MEKLTTVWGVFPILVPSPISLLPFSFQCPHITAPWILSKVVSCIQCETQGGVIYSILTGITLLITFFEQLAPMKNYESALHIVFHLILKEAINYPYLKYLPVMQETQVWSLGREDPLEKEVATHPSVPAWRIPWTEEPGGLQSMGSQRVGHDWATNTHIEIRKWKLRKVVCHICTDCKSCG